MLTGAQIKDRGIIVDGTDERYRPVSYDLTVGEIYVPPEDEVAERTRKGWLRRVVRRRRSKPYQLVEEHVIRPNGVVLIFSRETVRVPCDVCGYAMPKTSLGHEGILVLNTGVVDPLYHGPISGTTINFRDTPFRIKKGDAFLRLVFEQVEGATQADVPAATPRPNYIAEKILLAQNYPNTFLNLHRTSREVSKELVEEERSFLLRLIGVVGFMFAIITLALTQWQAIPPFTKGTSDDLKKVLEESQKTSKELQTTLDEVKKARDAEAAKVADQNRQMVESQAKTLQELKAANDDLRRRLEAVEARPKADAPKAPPK